MAKQKGISLEMDVMKKISHQLHRLPDLMAMQRVIDFMHRATNEEKLHSVDNGLSQGPEAGQLGLIA